MKNKDLVELQEFLKDLIYVHKELDNKKPSLDILSEKLRNFRGFYLRVQDLIKRLDEPEYCEWACDKNGKILTSCNFTTFAKDTYLDMKYCQWCGKRTKDTNKC